MEEMEGVVVERGVDEEEDEELLMVSLSRAVYNAYLYLYPVFPLRSDLQR